MVSLKELRPADQSSAQSPSGAKRALLASLLRQTVSAAAPAAPRATAPAGEGGAASPLPLSFVQRRLWFFDQLRPGGWLNNLPPALGIDGRLDVPALERSLGEIVRRHESLRTTFGAGDDRPLQSTSEPGPFVLPIVDLGGLPEVEREAEASRVRREEAQRPFDLMQGPLFRPMLVRLSKDRHLLLLTVHHIVCDGWSVGVLLRELEALYKAFASGQPSPFGRPPSQYADFVRWESVWMQSEALQTQLSYWKRQLSGSRASLDLPTDRPRPPVQSFRGEREFGAISAAVLARLKTLSRAEGATLFMMLLAAFDTLLSRYTADTDIVVGTPVVGRQRPETEQTIGCFVNLLALRTDLSGNPTFSELLRRVRGVALGAYAHQDLPFDRLIDELRPPRLPGRPPVFQVMLNMTNYADAWTFSAPGLEASLLDRPDEAAMYELTLYATELPDGIQLRVVYNADLFARGTVQQMLRRFERLIESVASDPEQRIEALPLAAAEERAQLAGAFTDDLEEA
jgi:hypothetical protein